LTNCVKRKWKNNKSNYSSCPLSSPSSLFSSYMSSSSTFLLVLFYSYTHSVLLGVLKFKRETKLSHTHTHRQAKCRLALGSSQQWILRDMMLWTLADRYQPKFRWNALTRLPTLKWVKNSFEIFVIKDRNTRRHTLSEIKVTQIWTSPFRYIIPQMLQMLFQKPKEVL
jgi:hypothetical protein